MTDEEVWIEAVRRTCQSEASGPNEHMTCLYPRCHHNRRDGMRVWSVHRMIEVNPDTLAAVRAEAAAATASSKEGA